MTTPNEEMSIAASGVLAQLASRLKDNGMDSPVRDARLLLALALGREDPVLPHETITMTGAAQARLEDYLARRLAGEPISRMRGWREFYSLRFGLNRATLDPRPDSECLVDAALAWLRRAEDPAPTVLDFGTGTGCLLLAVLHAIPDAVGTGVDAAPEAVRQARANAEALGLDGRARFLESDWDAALEGQFRLILSNPPYIPQGDLPGLMAEVRDHDPVRALDGGADGLQAWGRVLPAISRRLAPDGRAFVEIGAGQEKAVAALAGAAGLKLAGQIKDLSGTIRCLELAGG